MSRRIDQMSERELGAYMQALAGTVQDLIPEDAVGFQLVLFHPRPDGGQETQYVGNIDPRDAAGALRELADRLERRTYEGN